MRLAVLLVLFLVAECSVIARGRRLERSGRTSLAKSIVQDPLELCWNVSGVIPDIFSKVPTGFGKTHFVVGVPEQKAATEHVQKKRAKKDDACPEGIASLVCASDGKIKKAFFAPDENLEKLLIYLIEQEKKKIVVAVFSFTNQAIAQALIRAHQRGVSVTVIVDESCVQDRFNKLEMLRNAGITVLVYVRKKQGILIDKMHHKFVIFSESLLGRRILWNGSFNFSRSAVENQENVIILEEPLIVDGFEQQHQLLCTRCRKLK